MSINPTLRLLSAGDNGKKNFVRSTAILLNNVNSENRPLFPSSTYNNRFLYTGREWLGELGIYDYRNRQYSPQLGRFLQTDPIRFDAGDMDLYRYVANDPMNRLDPLGLSSIRDYINAAVTAAIMAFQTLTGDPTDIRPIRTPTSERAAQQQKNDHERKKRPRKPKGASRCLLPIDLSQDLEFLLDYDWDAGFQDNLEDAYGPPSYRDRYNPEGNFA